MNVEGVKSRIRPRHFLKYALDHDYGYLIFPPKTDSERLIILIYLVLIGYPNHITVAHILQIVLKEIVPTD